MNDRLNSTRNDIRKGSQNVTPTQFSLTKESFGCHVYKVFLVKRHKKEPIFLKFLFANQSLI